MAATTNSPSSTPILLSTLYSRYIVEAGYSEEAILGVLTLVVLEASFQLYNAPYWILPLIAKRFKGVAAFLHRHKIQKDKSNPTPKLIACAKELVKIHTINVLYSLTLQLALFKWLEIQTSLESIPSWPVLLSQVFYSQVCEDFSLYCSHRALHSPWLYKRFHKQHHEFTAPFSWAAVYAHPVEIILGNLLPMLSGPIILALLTGNLHIVTVWIWFSLRIYITTEVHSGYVMPWCLEQYFGIGKYFYAGPTHHDAHHERSTGNFSSTLVYLDHLFGTTVKEKPARLTK